MSLSHRLTDGSVLSYQASPQGDRHTRLALLRPKSAQGPGDGPAAVWQDQSARRFNAFVVSPAVLLAASQDAGGRHPALSAIDIATGREIWRTELAARAVKGGLAVNHLGQILTTLADGHVLCLADGSGD
jgi:outer membrane protein assembly factor BamB